MHVSLLHLGLCSLVDLRVTRTPDALWHALGSNINMRELHDWSQRGDEHREYAQRRNLNLTLCAEFRVGVWSRR